MKFIDLVNITVIAGNGGDGCISFQKKRKNSFLSKPDGSNGGDGGDVWLLTDTTMNTLNYFSNHRIFKAGHGSRGRHRNCVGKRGKDIIIKVPPGTMVWCQKTQKLLGSMVAGHDRNSTQQIMVAKGGRHGSGNKYLKYRAMNYKNIKNIISYYKNKVQGMPGEFKHLLLELFLMADVGVLGLPNSGKSSFIRIVSQAKPKVSDYPFTTLAPYLGTVRMENTEDRFIIADIPGIIKGASKGLGLGLQFLKHLKYCQMLLHFVDLNPLDNSDPINNIFIIEQELKNYDIEFTTKVRWLVFNKIDLLNEFEVKTRINNIIGCLQWKEPYYSVSTKYNLNVSQLCHDIFKFINHNHIIKN